MSTNQLKALEVTHTEGISCAGLLRLLIANILGEETPSDRYV
jgi:hypothetical protein